jgi:hypothetical protein
MAVLGTALPTLVDVAKRLDPDGKPARIAERLTQSNEILDDMIWKEGNLPTGEQTTVRAGLPAVAFRSFNEGVPRSKSQVGQITDSAAELAGSHQIDVSEAKLSGDVNKYRLDEATAFYESMNQTMASYLFYGNEATNPKAFNGLAPRFNSLTGPYGEQVIDAGGTGVDNHSIWLIVWGEQTVRGIYPKGSEGGLQHRDMSGPEGHMVSDANGNRYPAYEDWFQWNCGLSVKDPRYIVRAANIDASLLINDVSTGADIQDIMAQMTETVHSATMPGTRAAFYVPRKIRAMLRRQLLKAKNGFLSLDEIGGRMVTTFDGIPVRRTDALNTFEARVV